MVADSAPAGSRCDNRMVALVEPLGGKCDDGNTERRGRGLDSGRQENAIGQKRRFGIWEKTRT